MPFTSDGYIMTGKEVMKKIHQGEQQVAMFVLENNYQFPHLPIVSVFQEQNCSKKIFIYLNQRLENRINTLCLNIFDNQRC
jgi:hypothetical protein